MDLLSLRDVSKSYGAAPVLRGASLAIAPGEIHALMGENGAGKSTLIKILAGVVAPDDAVIEVDGQAVTIDDPAAAHRLGLRFIHQEVNVVPALSVAENIFIGRRYPRRAALLVDWRRLEAVARDTLAKLGITHIHPRMPVGRLSLGDRMLVRISSAFLSEADAPARLYVMDEPTAALTTEEAERLFAVLREIRLSGNSVLYVSHRIDEVMALCDRATVLRDGRSIDSGRLAEITHNDLVAMMIGRRVEEAYPLRLAAPQKGVALSARDLGARGLGPVSFDVRKGEVLGIAGLEGARQRELLRVLFGDLAARSGTMLLGGQPYRPRSPNDAWRSGIAYVPRERRSEGLVISRPIFENITLAQLGSQSLAGIWLTPRREQRFATALGAEVRLKARGPRQRALELSGGNQQKVVFAKALSCEPRLLLLDEPTRGVDVGAKFDIYTIIRGMTAKGMAVILVSSDLPELIGMCDRIAIMRDGNITDIVQAEGLQEDELINRCYGCIGAAA
ncbi:MAG TPA: sugar ABC transporter ATP-binding protein [Devosiaceae bacterium]|jgi:ribose transport system ATP-binding protein|nr:sugar ABC transporter ATP-binding protein [Devosiaceae bacterium]